MKKRIDIAYADVPRIALASILGELLADLNELYREKCEEQRSESAYSQKSDPGLTKALKDLGMEKWGPSDDFENLVVDLVDKYQDRRNAILGGKAPEDLEFDFRKQLKEIDCKCSLAKSLFCSNANLRIIRSSDEALLDKKIAVMPCAGSIYAAEVPDEEEILNALNSHFAEKAKKDDVIPGYI